MISMCIKIIHVWFGLVWFVDVLRQRDSLSQFVPYLVSRRLRDRNYVKGWLIGHGEVSEKEVEG